MRSPKLGTKRADEWYRYYAGFSDAFVHDVIGGLASSNLGTVLDPWNGSGTTLAVAREQGLSSIGYDINPALVLIARSRLVGPEVNLNRAATRLVRRKRSRDAQGYRAGPTRDAYSLTDGSRHR
jgi:SAM-dependent methyltransferase